jgi:hypothetical protein
MNRTVLISLLSILALLCGCPSSPAPVADAGSVVTPTTLTPFILKRRMPLSPPTAPAPIGPKKIGGAGRPIIPASWAISNWYIDPANTTTCANDTNNCQNATCGPAGSGVGPCRTWAEIVARWGTRSPLLLQTTTAWFLSSQPDATDPVIWEPFTMSPAATPILQGVPTQVATGTLGSVTAKNRATPQLLQADLGASAVLKQLVVNTTHPSSAWVYKNVSGTVFALSQPMPLLVAPTQPSSITEVDTWANGDAFTLYTLPSVNVVTFTPVVGDAGPSEAPVGWISRLSIMDPSGVGNDAINLNGPNIFLSENLINRSENINSFVTHWQSYILNFPVSQVINAGSYFGGIVGHASFQAVYFDADVILVGSVGAAGAEGPSGAGMVCLDGATLITGADFTFKFPDAGGLFAWGTGTINVNEGKLTYATGAGAATATFLNTGGLQIGGLTTAYSATGGSPATLNAGITITPAHLDAAAGAAGFGGNAFIPGVGSISNIGQ